MRYFAMAMLLLSAGCQTPAVSPKNLPPGRVRADVLGHWWEPIDRETPYYRFEIDYRPDGTYTARQWDRFNRPDGTKKIFSSEYDGKWRIAGTRLVEQSSDSAEPQEYEIVSISPGKMMLQHKIGFLVDYERKPTFYSIRGQR